MVGNLTAMHGKKICFLSICLTLSCADLALSDEETKQPFMKELCKIVKSNNPVDLTVTRRKIK